MNPHVVWNVWRRIMKETSLQNALFDNYNGECDLDSLGLSNEEKVVAKYYAEHSEQAKWPVVNYRYRLVNSFLNALESGGAPLVLRSLLAKKVDVSELGAQFLDTQGWKDYGPYVYHYCVDALDFLLSSQVSKYPKGFRQLIGLEKCVAELMIRLSDLKTNYLKDSLLLQQLPFAIHFKSDVKISEWLRDKSTLGISEPEQGVEHFLVYMPDMTEVHRFTLLTPRAAELYSVLKTPCCFSALPELLEEKGFKSHTENDVTYLKMLASYQAIHIPDGL